MAKREEEAAATGSGEAEPDETLRGKLRRRETERMMKRDAERHKEMEKKKEERQQSEVGNEKIDFFLQLFSDKREEIEKAINSANEGEVDKAQLPAHFDKITKCIQSLQNYVAGSSYFLREYDLRTSKITVNNLLLRSQELEEKLLPKKKFSFKLRKTPSTKESFAKKPDHDITSSLNEESSVDSALVMDEGVCGFSQKADEDLFLSHDMLCKKDVILSRLDKCTIQMPGVPSTLHISGLAKSRVLCGPVATSVFIEECTDCCFVLASHQVRIHSTRHCDFYIHVTTRAVIEDSRELRFAPYNWDYKGIDEHFELAELNKGVNNWDFVEDFNWLACDKPSPHWRIIKESERVKNASEF